MKKYVKWAANCAGGLGVAACAHQVEAGNTAAPDELTSYVKESHFTPFDLPRDNWGVGTVVRYENNNEKLVAFNGDCLKLAQGSAGGEIQSADVALESYSYNVDNTGSLEANLAKGLVKNVQLSAAFSDARVKSISIEVSKPLALEASAVTLQTRLDEILNGHESTCKTQIFQAGNYVINGVLELRSFTIKFTGSDNLDIKLDASLMSALKFTPEEKHKWDGTSSLQSSSAMFVGYTLYKVKVLGGFSEAQVELVPVEKSTVLMLKGSDR